MTDNPNDALEHDLAAVLNRHGVDTVTNTPDFILAALLVKVLEAFGGANADNDAWHGVTTNVRRDHLNLRARFETLAEDDPKVRALLDDWDSPPVQDGEVPR